MSQYDWLATVTGNTVFTVFDTETTGLNPKQNRVVEIGAIRFDRNGIVSRFSLLIDPGVLIPPEVTRINNITDAMLKGQPEPKVVYPDFIRFIGDSILIAHNAPFDVDFVNEELARLALPRLKNRIVDTRILAKEVFPGLPKYALQDLAVRFNIQAVDAHRAEDDSRVCMELFLVCLARLKELKGIPTSPPDSAVQTKNAGSITAKKHEQEVQRPGSDSLFDDETGTDMLEEEYEEDEFTDESMM